MKRTFFLIITLLCAAAFSLRAQSPFQTIKGRVTDSQSGSALPGASVVLPETAPLRGTLSDTEGYFSIPQVPIGRHTLKVSFLGYGEITIPNILVTSGKEVSLEIRLEEQVVHGAEVVIKGKRDTDMLNNEFGTLSVRSFNAENTRRFAGSMNDPARMASNFAGVSGANDARNDIIIRGNSPAGLLWRLEGIDIPNPSHFGAMGATGGPVSIINNNVLAQSDFFTGAFPANYGNALSGVFDLQLRTGNRSKREFTGQIGFNGFELGAEGPFTKGKRATYLFHYRYSVLALVRKLGANRGTGSSAPNYQDLSFKIDLPVGSRGSRWSIFGIGGTSDIYFKGELKDTANLYNDPYSNLYNASSMGVAGISYTHYFNEKTSLQTTAAASGSTFTTRIDSLDSERAGIPKYRDASGQGRLSITTKLTRKLNAQHLLSAGLFYHRLYYNLSDSLFTDGRFRTIRDENGNSGLAQGYVQWQYKPTGRLTLNTGVHSTWFQLNNNVSVEPRLGLRYSLTPRGFLSLAGSLNSQIQPLQLYFVKTRLPEGRYTETNRDLSMTGSTQVVLGYERLFGERVRLKIEGYYQKLRKAPVESAPTSFSGLNLGASFGSPDTDSLVSNGTGRNYGAELTLERTFDIGFYFLATASVFDSKAKGSDGILRSTAFNGRHVVNLLAGKEWKAGPSGTLAVDLKITQAGGRPYIPVAIEKSLANNQETLDLPQAYLHRFKPYFRSDLKITYRHNWKKMTHEWFIDFQNLTNSKNVFAQTFDVRSGKIRTQYQILFNPNFNYRIEF